MQSSATPNSPLTVWQLDPGAFTPFYERALCQGLQQHDQSITIRLLTTNSVYEQGVTPAPFEENFYFQGLNLPILRLTKTYPLARKIARGLHYLLDQQRLTTQIRQRKPHIVHVQWAILPRYDGWLWQRWQKFGSAIVLTIHDLVPNHLPKAAAHRYFRLYNKADALILHSERNRLDLAAWLDKILPDQKDALLKKTTVIPMGTFYEDVQPVPPAQARAKFGLNPAAPTLLYFGVIKEYKGIPVLLDAFRQVLQHLPETQLFIVGYVNPTYPGGEHGLRGEVADLPNIHLDLRYVPDNEISDYFAAADCTVLPYIYGTQSAVALTALTFGSPMIASEIGGLGDVVIPGETGWLVEPGNATALAEALLKMLRDPETRQRMSQNARQLAREKHGWGSIAQHTLAVYRQAQKKGSTDE